MIETVNYTVTIKPSDHAHWYLPKGTGSYNPAKPCPPVFTAPL